MIKRFFMAFTKRGRKKMEKFYIDDVGELLRVMTLVKIDTITLTKGE